MLSRLAADLRPPAPNTLLRGKWGRWFYIRPIYLGVLTRLICPAGSDRAITAIVSSSTQRNSALSLGSDRGAGDKGGGRPVVGLDVGRGYRLTRSVDI
jgi:hypothetical protein